MDKIQEYYLRFGMWLKTERNMYYTIAVLVAVGLLVIFG